MAKNNIVISSVKNLWEFYISNKNNERFKQVILLYSVTFVGLPIGIITSIFITRFLGPSAYGDYKFLYQLFHFVIIIVTFGLFQSGNRALVLNNDPKKSREFYGAELIILVFLFLIMSLGLVIYAHYDNNIHEKGLQKMLLYLIPFSWVFLLIQYFEILFQADNRIKLLASSRLYPKIGFLISVAIMYIFFLNYDGNRLGIILFFFISTQIIVFLIIIYKVNPSIKNFRTRIREILAFNKSYGFNVYLGRILGVGFASLTGVLISYFGIDNSGVGYFSLALTIVSPLSFIPNVIATTHFKDFSTQKRISPRLMKMTFLLSISTLILLWIIIGPFVKIFYGKEFHPVIMLTIIISIGMIFYGISDFFNRFLGAHGQGKSLRNSAFVVGFSLLILSLLLIPKYGETGAAIARAISGLVYAVNILFYYKVLVKKLKNNSL